MLAQRERGTNRGSPSAWASPRRPSATTSRASWPSSLDSRAQAAGYAIRNRLPELDDPEAEPCHPGVAMAAALLMAGPRRPRRPPRLRERPADRRTPASPTPSVVPTATAPPDPTPEPLTLEPPHAVDARVVAADVDTRGRRGGTIQVTVSSTANSASTSSSCDGTQPGPIRCAWHRSPPPRIGSATRRRRSSRNGRSGRRPGEQGEPPAPYRRAGSAPPGATLEIPIVVDPPRRRTRRVRPPAPRRQRPAQLQGGGPADCASGALMLPILRHGPRPTPSCTRRLGARSTRIARSSPRSRRSRRSAASRSPTSAPGSGTTRCCSHGARVNLWHRVGPCAARRGRRRVVDAHQPNIRIVEGAPTSLPLRDGAVDIVLTSLIDPDDASLGAVAEAQRVLVRAAADRHRSLRPRRRAALLEPEVVDHVIEATQRRTGWWLRHGFKIKVVHAAGPRRLGRRLTSSSAPLRRPRARVLMGPAAIAPPQPRPLPHG